MEWESPSGHFVQYRSEAEQVGSGVEWFAARLLRRHVGHGPHGAPRASQWTVRHCHGGRFGGHGRILMPYFGQAEIENFYLAAGGDEDVGRLDVAVYDALGVVGSQAICHLCSDFYQRNLGERFAADSMFESAPFEKFHA